MMFYNQNRFPVAISLQIPSRRIHTIVLMVFRSSNKITFYSILESRGHSPEIWEQRLHSRGKFILNVSEGKETEVIKGFVLEANWNDKMPILGLSLSFDLGQNKMIWCNSVKKGTYRQFRERDYARNNHVSQADFNSFDISYTWKAIIDFRSKIKKLISEAYQG